MTDKECKAARKVLDKLAPETFIKILKLAIWAAEAPDMELAYQDEEVMLFRRTAPLLTVQEKS